MAMSRDQDANFEIFLLFPNSTFDIRKSHKISSARALYFRSYHLKTSLGRRDPPSAFRVKIKYATFNVQAKGEATGLPTFRSTAG